MSTSPSGSPKGTATQQSPSSSEDDYAPMRGVSDLDSTLSIPPPEAAKPSDNASSVMLSASNVMPSITDFARMQEECLRLKNQNYVLQHQLVKTEQEGNSNVATGSQGTSGVVNGRLAGIKQRIGSKMPKIGGRKAFPSNDSNTTAPVSMPVSRNTTPTPAFANGDRSTKRVRTPTNRRSAGINGMNGGSPDGRADQPDNANATSNVVIFRSAKEQELEDEVRQLKEQLSTMQEVYQAGLASQEQEALKVAQQFMEKKKDEKCAAETTANTQSLLGVNMDHDKTSLSSADDSDVVKPKTPQSSGNPSKKSREGQEQEGGSSSSTASPTSGMRPSLQNLHQIDRPLQLTSHVEPGSGISPGMQKLLREVHGVPENGEDVQCQTKDQKSSKEPTPPDRDSAKSTTSPTSATGTSVSTKETSASVKDEGTSTKDRDATESVKEPKKEPPPPPPRDAALDEELLHLTLKLKTAESEAKRYQETIDKQQNQLRRLTTRVVEMESERGNEQKNNNQNATSTQQKELLRDLEVQKRSLESRIFELEKDSKERFELQTKLQDLMKTLKNRESKVKMLSDKYAKELKKSNESEQKAIQIKREWLPMSREDYAATYSPFLRGKKSDVSSHTPGTNGDSANGESDTNGHTRHSAAEVVRVHVEEHTRESVTLADGQKNNRDVVMNDVNINDLNIITNISKDRLIIPLQETTPARSERRTPFMLSPSDKRNEAEIECLVRELEETQHALEREKELHERKIVDLKKIIAKNSNRAANLPIGEGSKYDRGTSVKIIESTILTHGSAGNSRASSPVRQTTADIASDMTTDIVLPVADLTPQGDPLQKKSPEIFNLFDDDESDGDGGSIGTTEYGSLLHERSISRGGGGFSKNTSSPEDGMSRQGSYGGQSGAPQSLALPGMNGTASASAGSEPGSQALYQIENLERAKTVYLERELGKLEFELQQALQGNELLREDLRLKTDTLTHVLKKFAHEIPSEFLMTPRGTQSSSSPQRNQNAILRSSTAGNNNASGFNSINAGSNMGGGGAMSRSNPTDTGLVTMNSLLTRRPADTPLTMLGKMGAHLIGTIAKKDVQAKENEIRELRGVIEILSEDNLRLKNDLQKLAEELRKTSSASGKK